MSDAPHYLENVVIHNETTKKWPLSIQVVYGILISLFLISFYALCAKITPCGLLSSQRLHIKLRWIFS